jgi:hypothetical protein
MVGSTGSESQARSASPHGEGTPKPFVLKDEVMRGSAPDAMRHEMPLR